MGFLDLKDGKTNCISNQVGIVQKSKCRNIQRADLALTNSESYNELLPTGLTGISEINSLSMDLDGHLCNSKKAFKQ